MYSYFWQEAFIGFICNKLLSVIAGRLPLLLKLMAKRLLILKMMTCPVYILCISQTQKLLICHLPYCHFFMWTNRGDFWPHRAGGWGRKAYPWIGESEEADWARENWDPKCSRGSWGKYAALFGEMIPKKKPSVSFCSPNDHKNWWSGLVSSFYMHSLQNGATLHGWGNLWSSRGCNRWDWSVCVCACVWAHACTCMYVCVGRRVGWNCPPPPPWTKWKCHCLLLTVAH